MFAAVEAKDLSKTAVVLNATAWTTKLVLPESINWSRFPRVVSSTDSDSFASLSGSISQPPRPYVVPAGASVGRWGSVHRPGGYALKFTGCRFVGSGKETDARFLRRRLTLDEPTARAKEGDSEAYREIVLLAQSSSSTTSLHSPLPAARESVPFFSNEDGGEMGQAGDGDGVRFCP